MNSISIFSENVLVASLLASIILAALGGKIRGLPAWKGAMLGILFIFGLALVGSLATNPLLIGIGGVLVVGIASGAFKISPTQSANVILGCIIGSLLPIFFM